MTTADKLKFQTEPVTRAQSPQLSSESKIPYYNL